MPLNKTHLQDLLNGCGQELSCLNVSLDKTKDKKQHRDTMGEIRLVQSILRSIQQYQMLEKADPIKIPK